MSPNFDAIALRNADGWGEGFMRLPCPSQTAGVLVSSITEYGEWEESDCDSARYVSRKSDYYAFKINSNSRVQVELDSPVVDTWIRLTDGPHHAGAEKGTRYLNRSTRAVLRDLSPGIYTIEVTTYRPNTTFSSSVDRYTLKLTRLSPSTSPWFVLFGGTTTVATGESESLSLVFDNLTNGQSYTVEGLSNSSQIGFDSSCGKETSESFTAGSSTHQLSLRVFACSNAGTNSETRDSTTRSTSPISNISVSLHETGSSQSLHPVHHEVSVRTVSTLSLPPAPASVSASSGGRSSVNVSWSSVSGTDQYRVEYKRSSSSFWRTATSSATGASYRVWGLSCGTTYDFRVSAYGDAIDYLGDWGTTRSASARTSSCLPLAPAP